MVTVHALTRPEAEPASPIRFSPLTRRLISRLNRDGIRYCHWKSTCYLNTVHEAGGDLDLLIDRKDGPRFEEALASLGFKRAVDPLRQTLHTLHHYYGLDDEAHLLVHLHVYPRILTGESILKNHALPLEVPLLEQTHHVAGMPVPRRPVEALVLVIRLMLKHASILEFLLLGMRARLTDESWHEELESLLVDTSVDECCELLTRWLPSVAPALFCECVEALRENRSGFRRYMLARKLSRQLQSYNRFSRTSAARLRVTHFFRRALRRAMRAGRSKQFATGGTVIAFVGPEATGKSTLVEATRKWFAGVFAVKAVHAGKPPSAWLTAPFNLLMALGLYFLPALRHNRFQQTKGSSPGHEPRAAERVTSLLYAVRAVALAYDRRQLLIKARAAAANGGIVICDRYPCNAPGAMDSPRLKDNAVRSGLVSRLNSWLARVERQLYRQIPPPDIVLRLRVSVEIAKQRNRQRIKADKDGELYLERRHLGAGEWQRSDGRYSYAIDTDRSFDDTLDSVKRAIWECI